MPITIGQITKKRPHLHTLIFILAGLCVAGIVWWLTMGPAMIEQRKMEAYLHDKYGKDFSVTHVRREGAAIGAKGSMFGDAMPKDGSSDKFLVRETGNGYMDEYVSAIWEKERKSTLSDYVKRLNIQPVKEELDIIVSADVSDTFIRVPAFEDVLSRYGKDIQFGVRVITVGDWPNDMAIEDINKLIDFVKSINKDNYSVRYVINAPDSKSRYYCQYYGNDLKQDVNVQSDIKGCFKHTEGVE